MKVAPPGAITSAEELKGKQLYWVAPNSTWGTPKMGKVLCVSNTDITIDHDRDTFPYNKWEIPLNPEGPRIAFIFDNYWHAYAYMRKCENKGNSQILREVLCGLDSVS